MRPHVLKVDVAQVALARRKNSRPGSGGRWQVGWNPTLPNSPGPDRQRANFLYFTRFGSTESGPSRRILSAS